MFCVLKLLNEIHEPYYGKIVLGVYSWIKYCIYSMRVVTYYTESRRIATTLPAGWIVRWTASLIGWRTTTISVWNTPEIVMCLSTCHCLILWQFFGNAPNCIGATLYVTMVTCHHHCWKWWWLPPPLFQSGICNSYKNTNFPLYFRQEIRYDTIRYEILF